MFSTSQLVVFSPHATFIDRDGEDLGRDSCKLSTPLSLSWTGIRACVAPTAPLAPSSIRRILLVDDINDDVS